MSLSMSTVATQSFLQTLTALSKILDKAAAHCAAKKIDQAVLLQTRLTPDMFPLVKQVQLVCDFAKNTMGRLTGEPPKFPDEEKSLEDLKARIAKTIDYVKGFSTAEIDGAAEKDVTFPIGPQNTMTLKGAQYVVTVRAAELLFPRHYGLRHSAPVRRAKSASGIFWGAPDAKDRRVAGITSPKKVIPLAKSALILSAPCSLRGATREAS